MGCVVGKNVGLRPRQSVVQIQALPFPGCVTLGKLINLPVPQFFYLQNGDSNDSNLKGTTL